MPEPHAASEMAGARSPDMEERREPSSHFHHAQSPKEVPGGHEEVGRSRFEAFHRNYSQFDYPPRESGRRHAALIATGTFLLMLISALAVAAWMDPALVPKGASLLRTAGAAVGLVRPVGTRKGSGEQFGISPEELPYDGKAMPDTAADPAASLPTGTSSSGMSELPEHDAGAGPTRATEAVSASPDKASDPAKAEAMASTASVAPTSALDSETKRTPSTKPHPKQTAVSPEVRKKEISRLRRQAENELYAE